MPGLIRHFADVYDAPPDFRAEPRRRYYYTFIDARRALMPAATPR